MIYLPVNRRTERELWHRVVNLENSIQPDNFQQFAHPIRWIYKQQFAVLLLHSFPHLDEFAQSGTIHIINTAQIKIN